jgi:hypothetical protein
MSLHDVSNHGILNSLNCYIENARKMRSAKRPALFVFALMAFFCMARGAAGSTQLSLSPENINFGSVTVRTSSTQTITLANTGTRSVLVQKATVQGTGFSISGLTLPRTLAAGQSTTFQVSFAPTVSGSDTGSVSIGCSVHNVRPTLSLSGTGVTPAPSVSLSSSSLAFGNQSAGTASTAQTVTLNNTGNAALSIASIALTGTNAVDFAQSNNCGASVAAGASCTIGVTFTPVASGSFAAAVTLTDNANGSPQTVTLSGTGTSSASPGVSLSSASLSFGNEPVDVASSSQTITLNNTGNAALSVSSIAITGADLSDFTQNNTCDAAVVAGGNCTIVIQFVPSAAGSRAASLSITENASGSPQTIALSGTGTHDVILTWTASVSSGVAGYYVYRGTTSGGEGATPLNSTPLTGTAYYDTSVQAGATYYYTVTSLSSDETTQSAASSEASATVPSP